MKEQLAAAVQKALQKLFGITHISFVIEQPADMSHGDYATNVALAVSKQLGKAPNEIATTLAKELEAISGVAAVSVAGPGFINFTLASRFFNNEIKSILEHEEWGKSTVYAGKKILVEHSSPNLFKPFHIGHLMNNTIGEAIVRLAKYSSASVNTISFPSDISLGIAKAIFVLLEKNETGLTVQKLGDAYVEGTKRYDADEGIQARVKEIADNLYGEIDSPELQLFTKAKALNIAYFEDIAARLGSNFDAYIYESEAGIDGKKIVRAHTPRVFTESDGAIVYIPEALRKDINTAVFINSQGNPTYEAKDLGLIDMKFKRFAPDVSIFITDNNQIPHFNVVLAAAEQIDNEWKTRAEKSKHVAHGRMSFKGQKMSSRLGGVPLVEDILEAVVDEVKLKNPDVHASDAEAIGIASLKFSILRAQPGKNIDFDPGTSLSFEGDSGPYLQYSAVRAKSVLEKRGTIEINDEVPDGWETTVLEKTIIHFPEVVERSILEWAPHHIVGYLLELAQTFNSWYGNTKIIDTDNLMSGYKLAITKAFVRVMEHGLHLLAINVPEKM